MRVRSIPREGNAVCWNGRNIDEVRAVAGNNFVSLHSEYVIVEHTNHEVMWVRPGWWIIREDGSDDVRVYSAGAFSAAWGIVTENAVHG